MRVLVQKGLGYHAEVLEESKAVRRDIEAKRMVGASGLEPLTSAV